MTISTASFPPRGIAAAAYAANMPLACLLTLRRRKNTLRGASVADPPGAEAQAQRISFGGKASAFFAQKPKWGYGVCRIPHLGFWGLGEKEEETCLVSKVKLFSGSHPAGGATWRTLSRRTGRRSTRQRTHPSCRCSLVSAGTGLSRRWCSPPRWCCRRVSSAVCTCPSRTKVMVALSPAE